MKKRMSLLGLYWFHFLLELELEMELVCFELELEYWELDPLIEPAPPLELALFVELALCKSYLDKWTWSNYSFFNGYISIFKSLLKYLPAICYFLALMELIP